LGAKLVSYLLAVLHSQFNYYFLKAEFETQNKWDEFRDSSNSDDLDSFVGLIYNADLDKFIWESTGEDLNLEPPFWDTNEPYDAVNRVKNVPFLLQL